jgi:hypothetical protein
MRKYFTAIWIGCIVLLLSGATLVAQTITGSVRGTVTDSSGAVISGASVTVTNVATGVATHTVTNASGLYNFQFLTLGDYTVTASAAGFNASTTSPFHLQIDQIAKVDVKLAVGSASTTVKVAAGVGSILNTENATLGTSISANQLQSMPLPGQNVLYSSMFVPGALNPTVSSMASIFSIQNQSQVAPWDQVPSFNGNRQQGNNFVLDGIEINETTANTSGYSPSPYSLQEVRIITGNSDAEYGNVDGAEVLYVTKSGTNHFHGDAFEYFENQNFQANSYFNNYRKIPKGKFTQHLFGGDVGGPIFRNKLFFFADYQGLRFSNPGFQTASVPTVKERQGNFSETDVTEGLPIYNTSNGLITATQYPNDTIPAILNPAAKYLFAHPELLPLPNRPADAGTVSANNYGANITTKNYSDQGDARVDYAPSNRDRFMVKGTYGDARLFPSAPVIPVIFPITNDFPFAMGAIDWIHTFSPSLVNEFRAGYSRIVQNTETSDPSGAFGTHGDQLLGIGYPGKQPQPGFTQLSIGGSDNSSLGTNIAAGTDVIDNNFTYGDDITWVHGTHITRMGVQFVRYQENYIAPSNIGGLNGFFSYTGNYTSNPNALIPGGEGTADFELDKSQTALYSGSSGMFGARQWRNAFYVQDDWKVTPNFTLNLGLRYAYDQPMYEVNNKMSSIDLKKAYFAPVAPNGQPYTPAQLLSLGYLLLAGKNGNSRALVNPYYYQFMPRVGFAWQIGPRAVLRGGYSITDDSEGTGTGLRMTQNPPFLESATSIAQPPSNTTGGTPISVTNGLTTGTSGTPPSAQFDVWDPHFRPAAVQQFNLTTQFLLASKTSLQLGYVGQIGQHLAEPRLLNQYIAQVPPTCAPTDNTGCVDVVAPYYSVVGGGSQIIDTVSEGISNYHALQTTLHQQATDGLEFTLNYTWSHAMTDTPGGFFNVDGVGGGGFAFAQNAYDPHAEYGPSNFNVTSNFSGTAVYQLPFGHEKKYGANWNRLTDEVLGGWQLSANALFHTGFPITVDYTGNTGLLAAGDNYNYNFAYRPNQYFPLRIVGRDSLHWFGIDPSAKPCKVPGARTSSPGVYCAYGAPAPGEFGTAKNGTERAPGFRNVDLALFKGFRTFGNQSFKLRIDAFNVFNMTSLSYPNPRINSSQFGKITASANNARQLQISGVYTF